MKKLISILLVAVMLVAMVPAIGLTTAAETVDGNWIDKEWDLSWYTEANPSGSQISDTRNDVTVATSNSDGTQITVCTRATGCTFYIDNAAELSGLAKVCSLTNASYFGGSTFIIRDNIDLAGHYWTPIAHTQGAFLANVTGEKTGGGYPTISNMICSTSTGYTGLIGIYKAGTVKNLDMTDATIEASGTCVGGFIGWVADTASKFENLSFSGSITVANTGILNNSYSGVGAIIGYAQHGVTSGVVNCDSDATIIVTAENAYDHSSVGGIIGASGNGSDKYITKIDGCEFTGILRASGVDRMGGIVGWCQNITSDATMEISNCVSIPTEMTWGYKNWYQDNSGADWRVGFGGIVGATEIGNGQSSKLKISGCYVAGDVNAEAGFASYNKTNAGFVGNACGPIDFVDCQYDAVAWDSADKNAAFVSRSGAVTFTNCVNTGIAFNAGSASGFGKNAMVWVGQGNITAAMNNCYTSANELLYIYGEPRPTQITATTTFTGLDMTNTWTKSEGSMYPVLKIAKDLAPADSITRGGVDMTWLNTNLLEMNVNTVEQLNGVNRAYGAFLARDTANLGASVDTYQTMLLGRITLAPVLMATDLSGYNSAVKAWVKAELGIANVDTGSVFDMSGYFAQVATAKNADGTTYNIRFVTLIKGTDYDKVNFEVAACRNNNGTMQYGGLVTSEDITKCYSEVIEIKKEGSTTHTASEGYFYVVCVIKNIDLSCDTTFTVRASATSGTTVTQSAAVQFVVPVQA